MDKLEWDDLTEAAVGLIDTWENKRKKNKRMRMVVQLEYSKIEVFFLNQHNDEILKIVSLLKIDKKNIFKIFLLKPTFGKYE